MNARSAPMHAILAPCGGSFTLCEAVRAVNIRISHHVRSGTANALPLGMRNTILSMALLLASAGVASAHGGGGHGGGGGGQTAVAHSGGGHTVSRGGGGGGGHVVARGGHTVISHGGGGVHGGGVR